ncbi:MAG: zf-TFIIB domain-containing protein [Nocardioidaceae bacterium]|nr:zf-TFIIB domain-containing protein [Nocardioidaceae bacterium]
MDSMACPQCQAQMTPEQRGGVTVNQCSTCEGLFIPRSELGVMIERESEWHLASGPSTQPIPRIVPGMSAPPTYPEARQARSYVDELFG